MKVDVVLGLQWGDEGKGKIVDVLARNYPVICRFQGGPNAGHSLQFSGKSFVLHSVPAGVFRKNTVNVIGNGVVLDPIIFQEECQAIAKMGVDPTKNIIISKRAHLILPTHRIMDAASEASLGKTKIGSTLKGIGPTYMDKTGRNGLRVGEVLSKDFKKKFNTLKQRHASYLKQFDFEYDINKNEKEWFKAVEYLKKFKIVDSEYELNALLKTKKALAEGAQGTMLDVDFGAYPFVTSSSTICAGACTGLERSAPEPAPDWEWPLPRSARYSEYSRPTAPESAADLSLLSSTMLSVKNSARKDTSSGLQPEDREEPDGWTCLPSSSRLWWTALQT